MVFSSLIFLFVFLVLYLLVYHRAQSIHQKNLVLLVFSLAFYAWGGLHYILLLLITNLISWAAGILIQTSKTRGEAKRYLIASCAIVLGILVYFKYTGFFLGITHTLFGLPSEVMAPVLPLGISFYTFKLLSYVVDVYQGRVQAQYSYGKLLLYSANFHHCVAGPIVRYQTVGKELDSREVTRDDLYEGARRFCVGLAKKAVLAMSCSNAVDALLPIGSTDIYGQVTSGYWLGMLFYLFQIYLDFAGYSDMALGLGRMAGFHYLENFDYPYEATSVQDFWRRWHISLSSFFRDYVYIPLGGSRCSQRQYVRNMLVVWLLTGFWHGANWNFILWGLYYFAFLLLEKFVIKGRMPSWLGHLYTLLVVYLGFVFFKFEDFGEMGAVFAGMVGANGAGVTSLAVWTVFMKNVFLIVLCALACTHLGGWLRARLRVMSEKSTLARLLFDFQEALVPPLLMIVSVVALVGATYSPFIYFQF